MLAHSIFKPHFIRILRISLFFTTLAALWPLFTSSLVAGQNTGQGEWGILFYRGGAVESGVYWMRTDGSALEHLIHYDDLDTEYLMRPRVTLSPDGERMVISANLRASPYFRFTLFDRETETTTPLTSDDIFRKGFFWSPDSTQIAYLTEAWGGRLYLIDQESRKELLIARAFDLNPASSTSYFINVDWSPDGKRFALNYLQEIGIVNIGDLTIAVVNIDGSDLHRVLDKSGWAVAPTWASDNVLYYVCESRTGRLVKICAVDIERSLSVGIRDLTPHLPITGFIKTLDIAQDGQIVFSYDSGDGADHIFLLNLQYPQPINLSDISGISGSSPRWFYRRSAE